MSNNIALIKSFLDYCSDKGKVINENIANIHSSDYKRRNVNFESYLEEQVRNSAGKNDLRGKAGIDNGQKVFAEDKPVNIEEEMTELAKNTINFKFASKRISSYYKNLQSVIKSGG